MPSITCKAGGSAHTHHSVDGVRNHYAAVNSSGLPALRGRQVFHNTRTSLAAANRPPQIEDDLSKMLMGVKDGRYAVKMHTEDTFKFIRISRPKKGKSAGYLKIQSQHAEQLGFVGMIHTSLAPNRRFLHAPSYIPYLRMLVCDPTTAAMEYGRIFKRCSRCGIQLTDDRSRFYCIGPECEKYWPEIIAMVEQQKGPYVIGWDNQ